VITFDTTKHKPASKNTKLSESLFARTIIAKFLDRIEQFLIKDRHMLHAAVVATSATILFVHIPVQGRTRTLLTEVTGEWFDIEESNE
jgi:hypothetical protein